MRRFYFDPETRRGEIVFLSEEESRHVCKVLRLQVGTAIELLDGLGTVYSAVIVTTGRQVEARIDGVVLREKQEGKTIRLCQGILKGDKMDTVVQKATELGITRMSPFHSSRCQGKLTPSQSGKKYNRWQRIGMSACKQCLRLRPMQLDQPVSYPELLQTIGSGDIGLRLLFWEDEKELHLNDLPEIDNVDTIQLLLGPEGGFSLEEVEMARDEGWQTVSLGDRILRAETATLSAVSIVQFLAGNM